MYIIKKNFIIWV